MESTKEKSTLGVGTDQNAILGEHCESVPSLMDLVIRARYL